MFVTREDVSFSQQLMLRIGWQAKDHDLLMREYDDDYDDQVKSF